MIPKVIKPKKVIYLDYAATTPVDPAVVKAMEPYWSKKYGNPSSLHSLGKEAAAAVLNARRDIAKITNVRPEEIIFTAGGTESANLAIFGVARNFKNTKAKRYHIITSTIEHHAVLRPCQELEGEGYDVSYIGVNGEGLVNTEALQAAVKPETVLISIMYANNEMGAIQPIAEIGKWLKGLNVRRAREGLPRVEFHTDACQAAGALPMDISALGVDLLSANGSKIYGPKQTGFLYVRTGITLRPLIFGGGQEKGLRNGTENVPGAVGLAKAFQLVQSARQKENRRLKTLRDYFLTQILKRIPDVLLNGPDDRELKPGHGAMKRLPNNINVSLAGVDGEVLMLYLDSYNVAVSTGSACTTASPDPSHVIAALGRLPEEVKGSMRFTFGKNTTKKEISYVLNILPPLVKELRRVVNL